MDIRRRITLEILNLNLLGPAGPPAPPAPPAPLAPPAPTPGAGAVDGGSSSSSSPANDVNWDNLLMQAEKEPGSLSVCVAPAHSVPDRASDYKTDGTMQILFLHDLAAASSPKATWKATWSDDFDAGPLVGVVSSTKEQPKQPKKKLKLAPKRRKGEKVFALKVGKKALAIAIGPETFGKQWVMLETSEQKEARMLHEQPCAADTCETKTHVGAQCANCGKFVHAVCWEKLATETINLDRNACQIMKPRMFCTERLPELPKDCIIVRHVHATSPPLLQ